MKGLKNISVWHKHLGKHSVIAEMLNLKTHIDQNSGFCFGVVFAIEIAEEILKEEGHLYCLGDIVHNDEEVKRLEQLGLEIISHSELEKIKGGKVLIRAHGEPPETRLVLMVAQRLGAAHLLGGVVFSSVVWRAGIAVGRARGIRRRGRRRSRHGCVRWIALADRVACQSEPFARIRQPIATAHTGTGYRGRSSLRNYS